jgi:hypothetical protein
MNDISRKPTLSEAVAGMVSMIIGILPGLLRARGLRGLLELPAYFRLALELRRMAEGFAALFEAFQAGTLPRVPPAPPAPEPAPQEWDAAPARAPGAPRVAARPDRENRARRQAAPAADPEPDRPRAEPAPPRRVRARAVPRAPIPLPDPFAVVLKVPWQKNSVWSSGGFACQIHYDIVTNIS